jgi:putative ABC transport system permease protein
MRSALIIGLQGIRSRKTRTLLSMVSLFLGVLAVVVVQAGAEIAERAMLSNVELIDGIDGTRKMHLPADGQSGEVVLGTLTGRTDAVGILQRGPTIIGEPGVRPLNPGAAPFDRMGSGDWARGFVCDDTGCYELDVAEQPPGQAVEVNLLSLTGDLRSFKPFPLHSGQWLDFAAEPSLSPRIVINQEAAKFFAAFMIPAEMRLDGAIANPTPQIIGVVDDGIHWAPMAYARADEIANWMPPGTGMAGPRRAAFEVLMTPESAEIEHILKARLMALGIPAQVFDVSIVHSREAFETQLLVMQMVFLGMASLVLLIGVAGVLNVGLATVGERVEEFALRRAVGTPRFMLAGIVLAEVLLTGLFTAAAAIGFAALALQMVGPYMSGAWDVSGLESVTFPWQAAVAGVIAGLVSGLLGGLIPAVRAARIPIASVMRA